jgi:hypothetical protein
LKLTKETKFCSQTGTGIGNSNGIPNVTILSFCNEEQPDLIGGTIHQQMFSTEGSQENPQIQCWDHSLLTPRQIKFKQYSVFRFVRD